MKELLPLLPDQNTVDKMMLEWRKTLPLHIGDLFTHETKTGIERYDTYQLDHDFVNFIVTVLDKKPKKENIQTIAVIMGKRKQEGEEREGTRPTHHIFSPVLEVFLKEKYQGKKKYFFYLEPNDERFSFSKIAVEADQRLSPKVAELFILKWQILEDGALINAFEGLVAEIIPPKRNEGEVGEVRFGGQKLRRVKKYTFDIPETRAIINNIIQFNNPEQVGFHINLGAGLTVPDFHPFNFRPIIRISPPKENSTLLEEDSNTSFYDTSRPCPPFCDPASSDVEPVDLDSHLGTTL